MKAFTWKAAVAAVAVSLAAVGGQASAKTVWDYSTEYAPTSLTGRTAQNFVKYVNELTDGEVDIMIHFNGGLGFKSDDHYSAIEDGALQIADTPFNRMNGIYPVFDMQSLPFLQSTLKDAKVLDGMMRPHYNSVMRDNNQFVLFTMPWTPQGFWAKKKIESPADLKGMRIRVNDLAAVQTMKAAGADALQMSWGDTITGLSTGSINGVLTSDDTGVSGKLPEAGLDHFTAVGFTVGLQMVHVNTEAFSKLSPEQKTAVLIAANKAEQEAWELAAKIERDNVQTMRDLGVTVVTNDEVSSEFKSELATAATEAIENWKKRFGEHADTLLNEYQERVSE